MGRAPQVVTLLAALACAARPGLPTVQEQSTDARILVMELPDTVRVDIQSARGIGRATLARPGTAWPAHHSCGWSGWISIGRREGVRA